MESTAVHDVFTLDELARAAGVPRAIVAAQVRSGAIRTVGDGFVAWPEAVRSAHALRAACAAGVAPMDRRIFDDAPATAAAMPVSRRPLVVSSAVHAAVLVTALVVATAGDPIQSASVEPTREAARLVFLVAPGPGGGGGGSGARARTAAPRLERRGPDRAMLSVPAVEPEPPVAPQAVETPLEPLRSARTIAPVLVTKVARRDVPGVVDAQPRPPSPGPGSGDNAGSGRGAGSGSGTGAGLGDGAGGGTGGGPFRPGSGVEPPRLLEEVKASYTDEARRLGIRGEVLLEIVVLSNGRVGDVRVLSGLPAGLNERAVQAVRQWRFSPATRTGGPVDVVVEVAVEFTLR